MGILVIAGIVAVLVVSILMTRPCHSGVHGHRHWRWTHPGYRRFR